MENIDLAMLNVATSGDSNRRGELSRSDVKDEGGFADVLVRQEKEFDVDSNNNTISPPTQQKKQGDKVEPEERDRIDVADGEEVDVADSEESDVAIEGEKLFQEVPFQEASLAGEFLQVGESEDNEAVILGRQTLFSDLRGGEDGNSEQDLSLLETLDTSDEGQVLLAKNLVTGESLQSEAEGGVGAEKLILENGEFGKDNATLTAVDSDAKQNDTGDRADIENEFTQKSGTAPFIDSELVTTSSAKDVDAGLELVDGLKFVEANKPVENLNHVEKDQIVNKEQSVTVVAVPELVDQEIEGDRHIKKGHETLFNTPSPKGKIFQNGGVVVEIPEDVKIHINNEFTVAKAKSENSAARPGQGARDASFTGDEMGIFHLQGRARENQSTFAQGDHPYLKEFSEFKVGAGEVKNFSFSEISKEIVEDQSSLLSSLQSGVKEKQPLVHTSLKPDDMAAVHLETAKESLVKNSSTIVTAKPLPVSDENLMEQIKTGMARQAQGRQTVTIRLWPESMGKIDIKLVLREQQLSATFMVEQSDVKDAMLRKIDSLRDSLGVRGLDVKEIEIKVAPAKSGDGPSVTVGDQHQESADAWRQYRQGGSSQSDSGLAKPFRDESTSEDSIVLSENINSAMDNGEMSGSLHITA